MDWDLLKYELFCNEDWSSLQIFRTWIMKKKQIVKTSERLIYILKTGNDN